MELVEKYVIAESRAGIMNADVCDICHVGNQISSYIVRIIKWYNSRVNSVL